MQPALFYATVSCLLFGVVVCLDSESKECFPGAHPNSSFVFGDKCYWVSIPQTTVNLQVGLHAYQTYEFGKEGQWLKVPKTGQTWHDPHQLEWKYFEKAMNGFYVKSYCKTLGGHVAMPKTEAINNFLVDVLVNNKMAVDAGEDLFYIGFNNWDDKDIYLWDDCTRSDYNNSVKSVDTIFPEPLCYALDPLNGGVWRGFVCENSQGLTEYYSYICEFPVDFPPPPTTTTTAPTTRHTCQEFNCDLECLYDGYVKDDNGCPLCKCDIVTF